MNRIIELRSVGEERFRRVLASLLVLLMISDLGFHLVDPFLHASADASCVFPVVTDHQPEPSGECGIPGHEGAPFHHHHFPTLISQVASPMPLLAWVRVAEVPAFEIAYASIITPTGRAPPVS
jgi:hypothetical protein